MKPQELFGVFVRTIGLLLVMSSLWFFFLAVLMLGGGGTGPSAVGLLIYGLPIFLVGAWFLSGARLIVLLAYRE